jgi:hypothetical protein
MESTIPPTYFVQKLCMSSLHWNALPVEITDRFRYPPDSEIVLGSFM